MGWLLESFDPVSRTVLQALINSIVPGLVLALVTWFWLRSTGKTSATTRHAVWLVALIAITAIPILQSTARSSGRNPVRVSELAPSSLTRVVENLSVASTMIAPIFKETDTTARRKAPSRTDGASSSVGVSAAQATPRISITQRVTGMLSGRVPMILFSIYALVAAAMLARILWSYLFLVRVRRSLLPLEPELVAASTELQRQFGIKRDVRYVASNRIGVPMTIGWVKPLVILPPGLLNAMTQAELESIIAHELGHVRRWDYLTNLIQQMAQALLFFHPAVWLIGRSLAVERELACDDWAVRLTGEPKRYAVCLTKIVESLRGARPLAMATGIIFRKNVLSRRIEMILNRDRNAGVFVPTSAWLSAATAAVMVIALSTVVVPVIAVPLAPKNIDLVAANSPNSQQVSVQPISNETRAAVAALLRARLAASANATSEVSANTDNAEVEPVYQLLEADDTREVFISPREDRFNSDLQAAAFQDPAPAPAPVRRPAEPAEPPSPSDEAAPVLVAVPGPGAMRRIAGPGQVAATRPAVVWHDDQKATPVIPEAEMITILTDIVKRDADPAVRSEALRGIYRYRSDAGINALLGLYDSISDTRTKADILDNLVRSKGDNSRAMAKLTQVAKTEKDETLRSRALRQLGRVPGEEGVTQLIGIYDSLTDSKEKQLVIRYLGGNKSKKAADKLVGIAKTDTDPAVRAAAIRSLYAIDSMRYLDVRDKISWDQHNFDFSFNLPDVKIDTERFNEEIKRSLELQKDALERLKWDHEFKLQNEKEWQMMKEVDGRKILEKKIR